MLGIHFTIGSGAQQRRNTIAIEFGAYAALQQGKCVVGGATLLVGPVTLVQGGGGQQTVGQGSLWGRGWHGWHSQLRSPMDLEPSADINLRSPQRALIELRMAHADLDSLIDRAAEQMPADDLVLRRLKKRRLLLRDQISRLESQIDPPEPA